MAVYGQARRFVVVASVIAVLFLVSFYRRSADMPIAVPLAYNPPANEGPAQDGREHGESSDAEADADQQLFKLPLPSEYSDPSLVTEAFSTPGLCKDKFSTKFLEDSRDRRGQYCSDRSMTKLTCFHTVNRGSFASGSIDSFCLAEHGTAFDVAKQKFVFDCSLRHAPEQEKAAGAIPYGEINSYQYRTGPKFLLNEWTDIQGYRAHEASPVPQTEEKSFVILLKREVDANVWHCLNEIMAIMTTLDILRIVPGSADNKAIFELEDVANTEIVILDEHPDGPYFDLFQMFSTKKPLRLAEWVEARKSKSGTTGVIPLDKIVIPFAGETNNLWSDWIHIDCTDNTMLRVFVRRILDFYGIPMARKRPPPQQQAHASLLPPGAAVPRLNVTIINRKGSRKLLGLDTYLLEQAEARFADHADLRLVELETMPFHEQIRLIRNTDVLVGMHGAGLTHIMFMEEGRGAVVEIQPDRLCHKGFRNLAKMMRIPYIVAGASKVVGSCYPRAGDGGGGGELEMLSDLGTAYPADLPTTCYFWTANPEIWSFECSDPKVMGGEQSYMVCESHTDDEWLKTCTKKEAGNIWWDARYVMETERFLNLIGDAIEEARKVPRAKT